MTANHSDYNHSSNPQSPDERKWVYLGGNPPPIDPDNAEQINEVVREILDAVRGLSDQERKSWSEEIEKRRMVVSDPENYPPEVILIVDGNPTVEIGIVSKLSFLQMEEKKKQMKEKKQEQQNDDKPD